jgi:hypothetical protein
MMSLHLDTSSNRSAENLTAQLKAAVLPDDHAALHRGFVSLGLLVFGVLKWPAAFRMVDDTDRSLVGQ